MILPKYSPNNSKERKGVNAVAQYAASNNLIWRETNNSDVGIDGQLEYVNSVGHVTGNVIAVQVKSGPSYFQNKTQTGWRLPIELKHRKYWEHFPLPVIYMVYDIEHDDMFWVDVRQKMRASKTSLSSVEIPRQNNLTKTSPKRLFETTGVPDLEYIENIEKVLIDMIMTTSIEASHSISFFDLFSLGLTNICRSLYFGSDLAATLIEYNFPKKYPDVPFTPGPPLDFLYEFAKYLSAQNLVHIDWSDFIIDWQDRHLLPTFIAPLTTRGRCLVDAIFQRETYLIEKGLLTSGDGLHVAQEAFVQLMPITYFRRFPLVEIFQEKVRELES